LGFRGVVFSDDISMAAAESAGGIGARIAAHHEAGCDLILVCKPEIVAASLAAVQGREPCAAEVVASLRGKVSATWDALADNPQRAAFAARVTALDTKELTT